MWKMSELDTYSKLTKRQWVNDSGDTHGFNMVSKTSIREY